MPLLCNRWAPASNSETPTKQLYAFSTTEEGLDGFWRRVLRETTRNDGVRIIIIIMHDIIMWGWNPSVCLPVTRFSLSLHRPFLGFVAFPWFPDPFEPDGRVRILSFSSRTWPLKPFSNHSCLRLSTQVLESKSQLLPTCWKKVFLGRRCWLPLFAVLCCCCAHWIAFVAVGFVVVLLFWFKWLSGLCFVSIIEVLWMLYIDRILVCGLWEYWNSHNGDPNSRSG
jgi:hypothetical protein